MNFDADVLAAERAIDEMRCGRPIVVASPAGQVLCAAVETSTEALIDRLRLLAGGRWWLIVTPHRARALKWPALGGSGAVAARLPEHGTLAHAARLAAAEPDIATAAAIPPGDVSPGDDADAAVIALLKCAWLIPAALRAPVRDAHFTEIADLVSCRIVHQVAVEALTALPDALEHRVEKVSEAQIPLIDAPEARFVCFRSKLGSREHLAVIIGAPDVGAGVPVRLHSACLTGDVFGSLRCDCGEQLRQSIASLVGIGGGVLLYLAQEGRGIGLANKLRAYALQDRGRDTIDADLLLGFSPDERQYTVAAAILLALGFDRIRLMTNNPDKVEALQAAGITIVERLPLLAGITPHNRRYMHAKRTRARHLLEPDADASA